MDKRVYFVDSVLGKGFSGSPTAVVVMESHADDDWMKKMAREIGFGETAFIEKKGNIFNLRCFSPTKELPLCPQSTLAAAHILWDQNLVSDDNSVKFRTKAGELAVSKEQSTVCVEFSESPELQKDFKSYPLASVNGNKVKLCGVFVTLLAGQFLV